MVQAKQAEAAGLKLRPHSAKDTLTFLHKHFVKDNCDQFIIKWMLILRPPGIQEWAFTSGVILLVRAYLRTADEDYLGAKELHRVNKCITAQITDFEEAILALVSDKWKPITLADGVFDLDELKRDISSSDDKFAVRKYKPTALILILVYLTSRATRQQVPLPSFITSKPVAMKKKRSSDDAASRHTKRFRKGKQRPIYLLDQESEEDAENDQQDADWEEDQDAGAAAESDWDSLAFEQRKSFPHCTTPFCKEKNIAHTHSTDRCYKLHPQKGKGGSGKGSTSIFQ